MRKTLLAVAAGVLAQAALLAALSGMPPHHPSAGTTAFRVLGVGAVGGFVAAAPADGAPHRAGAATGVLAGVGVGVAFWWLVFHGETVGVFHHLHYVLATTDPFLAVAKDAPRLAVAALDTAVVAAFAVGGAVGGLAAHGRQRLGYRRR